MLSNINLVSFYTQILGSNLLLHKEFTNMSQAVSNRTNMKEALYQQNKSITLQHSSCLVMSAMSSFASI